MSEKNVRSPPLDVALARDEEPRVDTARRCPAPEQIEVDPDLAVALIGLRLATLIDIRQPFEIELKGATPGAIEVPFFHLQHRLGSQLTAEEQELLDADTPEFEDLTTFLRRINEASQSLCSTRVLLCVCNSGRRSLRAAQTLRALGYPFSFSVIGGVRDGRFGSDV
ncbi:MAG: rhodanese-like domain-containing protein [Thioalkalivibrionaceae bacterium]